MIKIPIRQSTAGPSAADTGLHRLIRACVPPWHKRFADSAFSHVKRLADSAARHVQPAQQNGHFYDGGVMSDCQMEQGRAAGQLCEGRMMICTVLQVNHYVRNSVMVHAGLPQEARSGRAVCCAEGREARPGRAVCSGKGTQ